MNHNGLNSRAARARGFILRTRSRHPRLAILISVFVIGLLVSGTVSLARTIKRKRGARKSVTTSTRARKAPRAERGREQERTEPERERYEQLLEYDQRRLGRLSSIVVDDGKVFW